MLGILVMEPAVKIKINNLIFNEMLKSVQSSDVFVNTFQCLN